MDVRQCLDDVIKDEYRMDALYDEFAASVGESRNSLWALWLLGENPEGATQKQLSGEMHLPKQTINAVVNSLRKRGLVGSTASPADGRSVLHALTPEGWARYEQAVGPLHEIEARCVREVGAGNMAIVHGIMKKYLDVFDGELSARFRGRKSGGARE